jgi:acetoin utilization deacetylase AcuC-like enzyme
MANAPTGFCFSDRYLQHKTGLMKNGVGEDLPFVEPSLHPSNHRLVLRTKQLVDMVGLTDQLHRIEPALATDEDLLAYHTQAHLDQVRTVCSSGGGDAGEGAPVGVQSEEIARLAAGGAIACVDAVFQGNVMNAFANVRPPGHHAMKTRAMGFCLFNNVVIAAHHARKIYGLDRIMVLDWDVHHGNGTQDAFYHDSSVLFFSIHQDNLYPTGWGGNDESGADEGVGFNVNIPLPAGSGDAACKRAFEQIVLPIAHAYRPELVLVSAGQDASVMDPLGRMAVTTEGYRWMTRQMMDVASQHAADRLVVVQEGGYSEDYAPFCSLAIVEALAGSRSDVSNPLPFDYLQLQPHQSIVSSSAEEAIAENRAAYLPFWSELSD